MKISYTCVCKVSLTLPGGFQFHSADAGFVGGKILGNPLTLQLINEMAPQLIPGAVLLHISMFGWPICI